MNKTIKFTITVIWILFSRGYDAYCTHQLTPDLSNEANPLVSIFSLTWTPLLIVLGLCTIYTVYAYYVSVFKPINLLPIERGYTFSNIVAYTYLGYKENISWEMNKKVSFFDLGILNNIHIRRAIALAIIGRYG